MSRFVVCASFLSGCLEDAAFYCDILFEFPKDNDLVVYADAPNGHVIKQYYEVAKLDDSGIIAAWLKCMINRSSMNFEFIETQTVGGGALFFELSTSVTPNAPVIVWSLERWKALMEAHPQIPVLDRLEGRKSVRRVLQGKGWKKVTSSRRRGGDVNITAQNVNANINSRESYARQEIRGQYDQAIRDISSFAAGAPEQVATEAKRLTDELSSEIPDRGIVQDAWTKLVGLAPKITSVAAAVAAVGKILGWG